MDEENIFARIGTFFIVMGLGFVIMFVASDMAETVTFDLFFVGILLGGLGIFMRRRAPKPPSSGRFETYKKWRSGELKKERAAKAKSQQAEHANKKEAKEAERAAKRAERSGSGVGLFWQKKERLRNQ